MDSSSGSTHECRLPLPLTPRIGAVRYDPVQFHRRVRARTTSQHRSSEQRRDLVASLAALRVRGEAPWADAMLRSRVRDVPCHSNAHEGGDEAILGAGPRWLLYEDRQHAPQCLRLSAPFARGGQSVVREALSVAGESFVVRTEYFDTAGRLPRGMQPARASSKWHEYHALHAAQSPLLPKLYLSAQREDGDGSNGLLHSVLTSCLANVDDLCALWRPPSAALSLFAAQIAIDVGLRLGKLHAADYGHFDVKPANILLTPDFTFELTDFGFARPLRQEAIDGMVDGSWSYMAPESLLSGIDDREVGAPSDMFSLGLTLLDVLTQFVRIRRSHRYGEPRYELRVGLQEWRDAQAVAMHEKVPAVSSAPIVSSREHSWGHLRRDVGAIDPLWVGMLDSLLDDKPKQRCTALELVQQARRLQSGCIAFRWLASKVGPRPADVGSLVARSIVPWATSFVRQKEIQGQTRAVIKEALEALQRHPSVARRDQEKKNVQRMLARPPSGLTKSASDKGPNLLNAQCLPGSSAMPPR